MVWRRGLDLSGAVDKPGIAFIQASGASTKATSAKAVVGEDQHTYNTDKTALSGTRQHDS
jgi:hypothetical protein